jgi:hypothetical protein
MRRREASANELAKIVSLRQNNSSWLRIEKETSVPRRIAQRAYRDWERSQERDEFKAARQTVAAEELRNHLASLKKLALVLVGHFEIPRPSREPQSAKQSLDSFLRNNIVGEYGAYGLPSDPGRNTYSTGVYYRQNQMLLKSLQDHTDQKLNLRNWESAYNTCRGHQVKFMEELRQILSNILNVDLKLAEAIASKKEEIIRRKLDGLIFILWESILAGKVESEELVSLIKVFSRGGGQAEVVFGNLAQGAIVPDDVGTQAKEACIWAIKNLLAQREKIIDPLLEDVKTMKRVNDDLAKVLNPLTLVPDILHSKCDLCPC